MATTYEQFPVMTATAGGVMTKVGSGVSVSVRELGAGSPVAESPLTTNSDGEISAGSISSLADGDSIEFYITSPIAGSAVQIGGQIGSARTLILDDTTPTDETEGVVADIYWRWSDESNMEPQPLGSVVAGYDLVLPFDLQGREVTLYLVSRTFDGESSDTDLANAVTTTFSAPVPPTISTLTFVDGGSVGDNDIGIEPNGGLGDISVWRSIDDDDFAVIATIAFSSTDYTDTVGINGTYAYKLTQADVSGESNIRTVVATGIGTPTGSPPSDLSGTWDGGLLQVDLSWTNNSGTGNNIVERRINNYGSWGQIASLSASATSYSDTDVFTLPTHQTYYYRIRVTSVAGYSNEESVYIPAE